MSHYIIHWPKDLDILYEHFTYPAGESQVRILPNQIEKLNRADKITVVANIRGAEDIIALCLLKSAIDGAVDACNAKTNLILPYLPYSRADRRFTKGDCAGLFEFSLIISNLAFNEIVSLDTHNPYVASGNFGSNFRDVSPKPLIDKVANEINTRNLAILLPDKGAARYNLQGKDVFQCDKTRDPVTGKLSGFVVPTKEQLEPYTAALIVDDICDGGGTFIGLAQELLMITSMPVYLYTTHGIYSQGVSKLLMYFDKIFCSDSFENEFYEGRERVVQFPALPLLLGE